MREVGWICAVLCVVMVVMLCGCHGSSPAACGGNGNGGGDVGNGDDGGDAGDALPLGEMRQLQDGDTWTYQVTGTWIPAGGTATPITPADAVVRFQAPDGAAVGATQVPDANLWSVEVPLNYGDNSELHENVAGVSQNASGQLFLEGYNPQPGNPDADMAPIVGGPLAGPAPADFATTDLWEVCGTLDGYGDLEISFTSEGVENVNVPAGAFQTYHGTGQKNLGGFVTDYEAWVNPQLGCYVKMTTTWEMGHGTLTMTHELAETSVL